MNSFTSAWAAVGDAQTQADAAIHQMNLALGIATPTAQTVTPRFDDKDQQMTISPTETQAAAATEGPTLEEKVLALAEQAISAEADAAALRAEAAKHTATAEAYKAEIRQLLDFGTHAFGNIKVSITKPSRSFDAAAFMKSYPVEANPALYTYVINSKALPPNLKDQFMAAGTGEPKVSIK